MRNLLFFITLSALVACSGGKTVSQEGNWTNFFGEWSDKNEDVGEYFKIHFESDSDTLTGISYYTGGPFEEILLGKLISDTRAELYFDYVMGSISFNRITEQSEAALAECRKKKVADCTINPDGTMTVQTFEDKCGQLPRNTTIVLNKRVEADISGSSDAFSVTIAEYSPQQLRNLLDEDEPKDVRDFLALLPDSVCYGYSAADRKRIAQGERVGEYGRMGLGETDIPNGYLDLSEAWEGMWEMFAKKEGNTWWIAVNQQYCGQACFTHLANTYTFHKGTLAQRFDANLAGYQDVWPELFIDFDQLTTEQKNKAKDIWEENGISGVLFRLPRDGKTITMHIDKDGYIDAEMPDRAFKEVTVEIWK